MKGAPNPRRAELRALSEQVRPLVRAGAFGTVNEAVIALYSEQTGAAQWRTFKGWIDAGRCVRKGEQGFPIWAQPRKRGEGKQEAAQEAPASLAGSDEGNSWFPVCYLFHEGQTDAMPAPGNA